MKINKLKTSSTDGQIVDKINELIYAIEKLNSDIDTQAGILQLFDQEIELLTTGGSVYVRRKHEDA